VVLVTQYRHPVGRRLEELPAGLLDVDGESALEAAKRELFEEAALRAEDWRVLLDLYTSPGMTDEAIRIYLARGLSATTAHFAAEHEELELTVTRVPLASAVRRALAGQITNAAAVAGILAAAVAIADELRPAEAPWPARPARAPLAG
jgi:ADP-ribose pyrophosphatase